MLNMFLVPKLRISTKLSQFIKKSLTIELMSHASQITSITNITTQEHLEDMIKDLGLIRGS